MHEGDYGYTNQQLSKALKSPESKATNILAMRTRLRVLQACISFTTTKALMHHPLQIGATASLIYPLYFSSASSQNFPERSRRLFSMTSLSAASDATSTSCSGGIGQEQEHTRDLQTQQKHGDDSPISLGLREKSWRSLIEVSMAKSRKIRGSNYVQLATVDQKTNEPRCRTVVFRGFQNFPENHDLHSRCDNGLSCVMKMCTDSQSRKVQEVSSSSVGEIVWWFPKSNEQYRIRGKILFVGGGDFPLDNDTFLQHARKELWGNLSDAARESFLEENIPGQPVSISKDSCEKHAITPGGRDQSTGKPVPPSDRFLLMLLFPHHVDYLDLKHNYRQIDDKNIDDNGWSFQQVNA